MHDLRSLILKLNVMAGKQSLSSTIRRAFLGAVGLARKPSLLREQIESIAAFAALHDELVASWLEPGAIEQPRQKFSGFDACDLRIYLRLAELAGVSAVPARVILSLTEDEIAAIDQKIHVPDIFRKRFMKGFDAAFSDEELREMRAEGEKIAAREDMLTGREIFERLFSAMDDVPQDWMVRSHICGPSTLKAMAGAGVIDLADQASGASWKVPVPAGEKGMEIGPGWIAHGNRRRVDATDKRYLETGLGGHKPVLHYMARPWVKPARWQQGEDPHRHGTAFAGKGAWPCEWRVFIENGKVTGVASYYAWCGQAGPQDAQKALEARDLAEKIVGVMKNLKLAPQVLEIEAMRHRFNEALASGISPSDIHPERHAILARLPEGGITCTLDFIEAETETGPRLLLLEGGPGHVPLGGGHPTGFAGHEMDAYGGCRCEGVGLRLRDGVLIGDPKTWAKAGPNEGHVLSWGEAEGLAGK